MFPRQLQQSEKTINTLISKATKYFINKNLGNVVEEELIEGIVMELLDYNITENRPTPKGNSYFLRKNNNTPIDAISVNRTP